MLQILENAEKGAYQFCAATSLSGNKNSIKRRIREISEKTSTKKYVFLPVTLLLVLTLVLGCAAPSNKSWLETGEWGYEEDEELVYYQTEYKCSLWENIRSQLFYYEIYQFGELVERNILAYGEIEDFSGDTKFCHKISKTTDERKLALEANGIRIEMQNPLYRHVGGGVKSFGSLQSEEPIEIIPEKSLILGMEYRAVYESLGGLSAVYSPKDTQIEEPHIQTYDCNVISDYTEEELYDQYVQSEMNGVVGKLSGKYTDCETFTRAWAEAFAGRDADTIAGMVTEEAYEQLKAANLMGEGEGYRYFGWSSPWPLWNEKYKILSCDDSGAEILYYAEMSIPHVYVWKETLQFERSGENFLVKSESLRMLEQIQSMGAYYEAYPEGKISGTMMDYSVNGLGEILNQNALEQPKDEYYKTLFDAGTAALELLNISKDEELINYSVEDVGGVTTVQIYFLIEDAVSNTIEVTMWQPYGEDGIWIPK